MQIRVSRPEDSRVQTGREKYRKNHRKKHREKNAETTVDENHDRESE